MNVTDYMRGVESTDQLEPKSPSDSNFKVIPILGLAGEIGSLLTELKKRVHDRPRIERISKAKVAEELGDIVWYSAAIARRAGLDFQSEVLLGNLERVKNNTPSYLPLFEAPQTGAGSLREALNDLGLQAVEI